MKENNANKNFKIYSTFATVFIITTFIISLMADQKTNTNSSMENTKLLDETMKSAEEIDNKKISTSKIISNDNKNIKDNTDNDKDKEKENAQITYIYPVKGDIIIKFSPTELIYDKLLDQYRTSDGITMQTNSIDLNAMCDSKILSIEKNDTSKSKVTLMTTDNHIITISGHFINFIKREGDVILKGSKLCDINSSNEYAYVEISINKDNKFIDPCTLIK